MRYPNTDSAQVVLAIPGGSSHENLPTWGDRAPSLLQRCANEDFEVEVKFTSRMRESGLGNLLWEGIYVWDTTSTQSLLRFDLLVGGSMSVSNDSVCARAILLTDYVNGAFSHSNEMILRKYVAGAGQAPLWVRVKRTAGSWQMSVSLDGSTFVIVGSFELPFVATRIGPAAGNAGLSPAAFACGVDYFYNRSAIGDGRYVTDTGGPFIHGVRTSSQANAILLLWKTDEPADQKVEYGTTTIYGSTTMQGGYYYDHRAIVSGLPPHTTYHFRISGSDDGSRSASTGDTMVSTGEYIVDANLVSDDFNSTDLDRALWTIVDPRGDGTVSINEKRLSLSVPSGMTHNLYTDGNYVLRVEQPIAANANSFELSVKYVTPLVGSSTNLTSQGIILEQDPGNLIRACYLYDGAHLTIYADAYTDGLNVSPEVIFGGVTIPTPTGAYYLKVRVTAAEYRFYWSLDGQNWNPAPGSVVRPFQLKKVELFAGNAGSSPKAYTSLVDQVSLTLPSKPALTSPANNATGVPAPTILQWDSCSGVASYTLQLSTDPSFASLFYSGALTSTYREFPSLATTTRYYWRVRSATSNVSGPFSSTYTFVTAIAAPLSPTLLAPFDNMGGLDTAVTLQWTRPQGATSFALQVATDSSFRSGFAANISITDTYQFISELLRLTRYYWRVYAAGPGGMSSWSSRWSFSTSAFSAVGSEGSLPREFGVDQNYPNPFNPDTEIRIRISVGGLVQVKVFDLLGREIATLMNEMKTPGYYRVKFEAAGRAAGVYLYRVTSGDRSIARKMLLVQ